MTACQERRKRELLRPPSPSSEAVVEVGSRLCPFVFVVVAVDIVVKVQRTS
jgi:hypothetical protein